MSDVPMRWGLPAASLLLASGLVIADESPDVRFSGFATLAVVHNSSDRLGYRSNSGQDLYAIDGDYETRTDSRLGLQWNLQWNPQFDAAVQLVLDQSARDHHSDALDWAFVRWRPQDGDEFRVGRLGFDVFMLSDYRQIAYTYPWTRPPLDFYSLIALHSIDGVDYQHRFDGENGTLFAKVFAGTSHYHAPLRSGDFSVDLAPVIGFTLLFERDAWKARLSRTQLRFASEAQTRPLVEALQDAALLWPDANALANELYIEDSDYRYRALGVSYDDNTWLLQAELAELEGERDLVPSGKQAYLSLARRFDTLTPYLLFGWARPEHSAVSADLPETLPPGLLPAFSLLRDQTVELLNRPRVDQDSIGIGLRWDFRSRMALKLQCDRFRVHDNGSGLWHPDYAEPDTTTVVSVALDLLF
ncbi:MAG: hypothetical protein ACK4E7_13445 [Permianibacter sp.]